ncbi:nuclear transport factor 2 family protein [Chitinophaga arvensicola]|uniref:Ketosteroid isomerase-related protein n=1 Tax=Chitinophaga arvensicola TaxID=29529 RepID=A0A1I0S960_9BACT|nr:nuclear transport factor 2 family protein [Chitinophaga arvensicola]SEW51562.1 Ketosteroid isomerase-related protein [Chitinophaga arvensicola]
MEKSQETRKLLDFYYKGFAEKANWESVIAEDFRYTGGDMNNTNPVIGKQAYIDIIKRFSQRFEAMRVQQMVVDGDNATVIGNYDFVFPNGVKINGNVAECWRVKDGKLSSLTLYFDTLTFMSNLK